MPHDIFVCDTLRVPRGEGRGGALHGVTSVTPPVGFLRAVQERNSTQDPGRIDDLALGHVSPLRDPGLGPRA